jgi:Putative peptidoglycan binding domain
VRERRYNSRRRAETSSIAAAAGGLVGAILWRLWVRSAQRPVDTVALLSAVAFTIIIVVNAIFLQHGAHLAPFVVNPSHPRHSSIAAAASPRAAESAVGSVAAPHGLQPVSARHNDAIANLISSFIGAPTRVIAVQRALSDYGYGQLRPSGVLDEATSAAIEKFEREHHMAVTGRLSDQLIAGLAAMTGRPLD